MKKNFLKGEIATVVALGTLIILGISSLVSSVFLKRTHTTKTKASGCSQVFDVSYSGEIGAGKTFTCKASTDGASSYTMACGISKNGGWPMGMISGSCSGGNCSFSVKMDDQIDSNAIYELVAFDFRTECGPNTGKRITLNVSGSQPQPTQANCDSECCGKPDGFIYQGAIKERCDPNYKGGRYVIIDGICQGGKKAEKPGCATCKSCQPGAPDIAPVPGADLAVNECTSSCEQSGSSGICSDLPECPTGVTPAIVRSCSDTSFSCTAGYTACKKEGAIWCYGGGSSGGSSGGGSSGGSGGGSSSTPSPNQTECEKRGGFCWQDQTCENDDSVYFLSTEKLGCPKYCCLPNPTPPPITPRPPCDRVTPGYGGSNCSSGFCSQGSCVYQNNECQCATLTARPQGGGGPAPGTAGGPCRTEKQALTSGTECSGNLVCHKGICVTPSPITAAQSQAPQATNTPTPITAIPNDNEVLNLKGSASFFINLSNTQYSNYFNIYFFSNILNPFLTKNKSCSLGERISNGCHPSHNLHINNNSLEIRYDNLERYYNSYGLEQIDYTFELSSSVLNNFDYRHNFVFPNFYATTYSQNTGKNIDLSQFLRIIFFKFKKENNYVYQEGESITFYVSPYPSLYFYNGQNKEYINAVAFDKEIKLIYLYNFVEQLPQSIVIDIYYNCAPSDGSRSFNKYKQIILNNLNTTENNGGEITLNCSD